MIYDVIEKVAEKAGVSRLCEQLGVSRAGFYTSRQRARQPEPVCPTSVSVGADSNLSHRAD